MALYINGNKTGGGGGGNSNMRELTQAEYDALTTEEKNNGTVYYITDGDDGNGGYQLIQPIIYSEEEREVGVWVDGKPLYQKTIVYTDNISTEQSIQHGILNLDKFIFVSGYIEMNWEGGGFEPLINPALGEDILSPQYSNCIKDISSQAFTVCIGQNRLNQGVNAIVVNFQYTKTTDVAGSGKWTPQGIPAVHYNTEEQVVGTWINGKTVYEKTFYIQSMGNYDDSIDGYLIAENIVVDDLIEANGFVKIATGLNLGHSYVHITNGFSMLNSYEFALHLNDKGQLLLWTDTGSLGGGIVGQELFITIQYTKPTT